MATVILKNIGSSKVKVIKMVRELTGLDLKEAKSIVDKVEAGEDFTFETEDPYLALSKFAEAGAMAMEKRIGNSREISSKYSEEIGVQTGSFSNLGREETLDLLSRIKEIAEKLEKCVAESESLAKEIAEHNLKVEQLRKRISKKTKFIIWSVTIVAVIIGNFQVPVAGAAFLGIIALVIMNKTVKKRDLRKHQEQNEAAAKQYIKANIEPLTKRLDEVRAQMGELSTSGKIDWALDIVGEELFDSACIEELYKLVKGRRADNLKEALNLYDSKMHRENMEKMQKAIQDASKITAEESRKQTAEAHKQTSTLEEIEKNTRKTANAARVGAAVNAASYFDSGKSKR